MNNSFRYKYMDQVIFESLSIGTLKERSDLMSQNIRDFLRSKFNAKMAEFGDDQKLKNALLELWLNIFGRNDDL